MRRANQQRILSGVWLNVSLRLLDEPIDVGVGKAGGGGARTRLPSPGDQFALRLNGQRHTFIGADAAALQLFRDFSGSSFDHIGCRRHPGPSFKG
jgi:hypothetical protein